MNKILMKIFSTIVILMMNIQVLGQGVIINEFMSNNSSSIQDFSGDSPDWIELYNNSDDEVNLLDFGLSDDVNSIRKWLFPNITIQAHQYLLIFASGNDFATATELHTNFKLKQSGETLVLTNKLGFILSLIQPIYIPNDKSFACTTDGNEKMTITETPTPNSSNNNFSGIYSSHLSGFYKDSFNLTLLTSNTNNKIYYTLNGETPSINSQLYTTPITIKNNQQSPLNFSLIPTTPLSGEDQLYDYIWEKPQNAYKCNVLRYASFENNTIKGSIYTRSFFVDKEIENRYTFPVISIVTDSLNIFDHDTGIYIPGKRFDIDGFNWWPEGNYHNRGEAWERDIHISYFENKGLLSFETNAGMRMRGYGSASNPQKSFTTYFRKEYGMSNIEYPVFKNSNAKKHKRLIFRNSGNDFLQTHFKDAMLQQVIKDMDLDLQGFQPSVVFLNGEYWGIHNIREKYDKFYFKYKLGVKEDEVNILSICGGVEEGNNRDYKELTNFVKNNDLSKSENYNLVANKLDINNFIDFQIAEIYFANYDWPCNNFKIWKDNDPTSKWRFLIYDLDLSFGLFTANSMEHATSENNKWPHCECSNLLFRNLLKSKEFESKFLDRFVYCLENIFDHNRVNTIIDEFELMYSLEIEEHIDRWNYPSSKDEWKNEIDEFRTFATNRQCYMSENIISYFRLSSYEFDCISDLLEEKDQLALYPNPTKGKFAIINNSTIDIEDGKLILINSLGQIIYSREKIKMKTKERSHFQLSNLHSGIYICLFTSKNLSKTIKVFVTNRN